MAVQEFKRPIELAALKGRLERAQKVQSDIAVVGARYDKVLGEIEDKKAQAAGHVGYLEQYNALLDKTVADMIGATNNPPDEEKKPDGQSTNGVGTEAVKP